MAAYASGLFWLSHQRQLPGPPGGDKTAHVVAYAGFGACLSAALVGWSPLPRQALATAMGAGYGVTDEWHQSFVPGRDASAGDLLADAIGAALGALGGRFGLGWWRRRRCVASGPVPNSGGGGPTPSNGEAP